jgi:hypothetical protein
MNGQQHVVIVTGGRSYPSDLRGAVNAQLNALYVTYGNFVLFHGACQPRGSSEMTGADRYADDWAQAVPGIDLRRRPADWIRFARKAGPIRNEWMVVEACQLAPVDHIHGLAFPEPDSVGTWDCARRMCERGIEVDTWDVDRSRKWLVAQEARS